MRLLTNLVIKIGDGDPGFLVEYAREKFEVLSFLEIDELVNEVAYSGNAEYICDFARLLNENGYDNGNITLLAEGLRLISKDPKLKIKYISEFISTVKGISKNTFEELKYELDSVGEYDEVDARTLTDIYYDIEDLLTKNDRESMMITICDKYDFECIIDILNHAKMTDEQRKNMIVRMHDILCLAIENEEEKQKGINLILDQYNSESLVELNKKRSFDYDFEKYSMTNTCISAATPEIIHDLMFSMYDFDKSHISRMIDKLIDKEEYNLLIDILEEKVWNADDRIKLSSKDIDKAINAICKTRYASWIYSLADAMDGYLTEKQILKIRRSMFKSIDPDTIVKYALELDGEAVPAKFKSVEKFYNYVDENMIDEKEKQDAKEEILNPRSYRLINQ